MVVCKETGSLLDRGYRRLVIQSQRLCRSWIPRQTGSWLSKKCSRGLFKFAVKPTLHLRQCVHLMVPRQARREPLEQWAQKGIVFLLHVFSELVRRRSLLLQRPRRRDLRIRARAQRRWRHPARGRGHLAPGPKLCSRPHRSRRANRADTPHARRIFRVATKFR